MKQSSFSQHFHALLWRASLQSFKHPVERFFVIFAPASIIYFTIIIFYLSDRFGLYYFVTTSNATLQKNGQRDNDNFRIEFKIDGEYTLYYNDFNNDSTAIIQAIGDQYKISTVMIQTSGQFYNLSRENDYKNSLKVSYIRFKEFNRNNIEFIYHLSRMRIKSFADQYFYEQSNSFLRFGHEHDEMINILQNHIACYYAADKSNCLLKGIDYKRIILDSSETESPVISDIDKMRSNAKVIQFFSFAFVLGYALIIPFNVKRIIVEKESKLREFYRMLGATQISFWLSHFMISFFDLLMNLFVVYVLLFCCRISLVDSVFAHRMNPLVFSLCYLISGVQFIWFSFFIASFFSTTIFAICTSLVIWFVFVALVLEKTCPFYGTALENANTFRAFTSLLPWGSYFHWMTLQNLQASAGRPFDWSTLMESETLPQMSHATILVYAILSLPIYITLTFYVDSISVSRLQLIFHPIYLFKKIFRRLPKIHNPTVVMNPKFFEPPPPNTNVKIQMFGVEKIFDDPHGRKKSINNIYADFYEHTVTVILGHNGSGKTTLLSMIAGIYDITKGIIRINGYNVDSRINCSISKVGFCPQIHVHCGDLTVAQLFKFFALLKGIPFSRVTYEVNLMLIILELDNDRDAIVANLPTGDKKKVDLGIAMIGDTDILLLDEPTFGMDRETSRLTWNLLLAIRKKKTIILSTYSVEEADILADRIMIMNEGSVTCYGSPSFLKSSIRTGYILKIKKSQQFDRNYFLNKLRAFINDSDIIADSEAETVYRISPLRSNRDDRLPKLFAFIESYRKNLHIKSFGVTYTSLEDVFLTVMSDLDSNTKDNHPAEKVPSKLCNYAPISKHILLYNRITALFIKRFRIAMRQRALYISQLFLPAMIFFLCDSIIDSFLVRVDYQMFDPSEYHKQNHIPHILGFYGGDNKYLQTYVNFTLNNYNITTTGFPSIHEPSHIPTEDIRNRIMFGATYKSNSWSVHMNCSHFDCFILGMNTLYGTLSKYEQNVDLKVHYAAVPNVSDIDSIRRIISWALICIMFSALAFSFLGATYIIYPVDEHVNKLKFLQFMTGLSPALYWTCNFLFDMCSHLFTTFITVFSIYIFDRNNTFLINDQHTMLFMTLMSAYGFATIPFAYFLSLFFKDTRESFSRILILFIYICFLCNFVTSIFYLINAILLKYWALDQIPLIFSIFPIFNLLYGLQKAYLLEKLLKPMAKYNPVCYDYNLVDERSLSEKHFYCVNFCEGERCVLNSSPFSLDEYGSATSIILLIISGFLYFTLTIAAEYNYFDPESFFRSDKMFKKKSEFVANPTPILMNNEADCAEEVKRIEKLVSEKKFNERLIVRRCTKKFGNTVALNSVTFGIAKNQCFGLLGINGSGKTTLLSVISGEKKPTSGDIYLAKYRYNSDTKFIQFNFDDISYCPQNDPVMDYLTGEDLLNLFGKLRGITSSDIAHEVRKMVELIGLQDHYKQYAMYYSSGNKRKLAVAIALIGLPKMIILDEPTAGIDPRARRKIWEVLNSIKKQEQSSFILASHWVEECEALCSKIAIIVEGQLRCIGKFIDLKKKYTNGFTIVIRLNKKYLKDSRHSDEVQGRLITKVLSANLQQNILGMMQFYVSDKRLRLSQLFQILANLNHHFEFEDYYISDSNLDQLFISVHRDRGYGSEIF